MLKLAFLLAVFSSSLTSLPTSLAEADYPTHFQQEVVIAGSGARNCPLRVFKFYLKKTEDSSGVRIQIIGTY
jgi:hypothetical protein